jgi:hypothetical protein
MVLDETQRTQAVSSAVSGRMTLTHIHTHIHTHTPSLAYAHTHTHTHTHTTGPSDATNPLGADAASRQQASTFIHEVLAPPPLSPTAQPPTRKVYICIYI